MVDLALVLLAAYALLTFGVRIAIQVRRTGSTGLSRLGPGTPPAERVGGALFLAGILCGGLGPILVKADTLGRIDALQRDWLAAIGVVLAVAGIVVVFVAQMQMGASWRIGVDESERTDLVSAGIFSLIRNPIYTAMIVSWIGFALMVPTWIGIAAIALAAAGLEIQVRLVEEPHMVRAHGDRFIVYARGVGRFLPGIGRGV